MHPESEIYCTGILQIRPNGAILKPNSSGLNARKVKQMTSSENRPAGAKTILAAIIGHVFWGFSFIASRTALDRAHVFTLLSHRFLIAFIVMSLLVLFRVTKLSLRGKGRRALLLVLLGLAEPVAYFFGEQYGILHSTTIFSGVMIAMIPVAATLAAAVVLREKPTVLQLVFCLISIGGVVGIGLMNRSSGSIDSIGVFALIGCVLAAVVYTLLSRGLSQEFTPFERTYMMIAVGAAVFTALALIRAKGSIGAYLAPFSEAPYTLSVLFLSLFCSVAAYFLSSYAITHMSVARTTVFANLTTAVSVFAGAVILHEPFSAVGIICCVLILAGIWGVQKAARDN